MRSASVRLASLVEFVLFMAACQAGASPSPSPSTAPPSAAGMTIALKGDFHPVDDEASGVAELVQLADGSYQVIFESFSIATTENLKVYLVTNEDVTASTDGGGERVTISLVAVTTRNILTDRLHGSTPNPYA